MSNSDLMEHLSAAHASTKLVAKNSVDTVDDERRPGGYSRTEVKKPLSLSLNSELTYSEMGNYEYPVPEQLI